MAVYEQTYEPWSGACEARPRRALSLFASTFRLTWRNLLVKVFLIFLFILVFFWIGFLLFAATARMPPIFALGNRIYRERFFGDPVFHNLLMVVTAVVGAGLVSLDWRNNAFSMYFSKSIGRADYLASKYMVVLSFIGLGTFAPAFLLWLGQLTIGRETYTFMQYYADLSAVFAHSLAIALPAGAIVLAFSSLSRTRYIPAIMWIFLYEGTELVSALLSRALNESWTALLSYRNLTAQLGTMFYEWRPVRNVEFLGRKLKVFSGIEHQTTISPAWIAAILALLTVVSLGVVWRRLRSIEAHE